MQGLHILAEFHACAGERRWLEHADDLANLCRRVCREAGLVPVAEAFHQFAGAGATGAVVLAESHLAIHTWPEISSATLDLYVCNFSQNNRKAAEAAFTALQQALQPQHIVRRDIQRGEVGLRPPEPTEMR